MGCSTPPSLYYIFEERIPSFWMRSQEGFGKFGNRHAAIVVVGNEDTGKIMDILKCSLGNFGVRIKSDLTVVPKAYPLGGGIKGGLIGNREIQEKLKILLEELIEYHKDS
jgi:hypothetical protein